MSKRAKLGAANAIAATPAIASAAFGAIPGAERMVEPLETSPIAAGGGTA